MELKFDFAQEIGLYKQPVWLKLVEVWLGSFGSYSIGLVVFGSIQQNLQFNSIISL